MNILILVLIFLLYIVGMGSILYSIIYEKDIVRVARNKPPQYYPQQTDSIDTHVSSILDDENFSIDSFSEEDNNTVVLDLE